MGAQRIRRVANPKEMEQVIDDYITQGYKVKSRGEATATVKKENWGTAGWHILWFCLTLGIGNIIYALVSNSSADSVLVRIERGTPPGGQQ